METVRLPRTTASTSMKCQVGLLDFHHQTSKKRTLRSAPAPMRCGSDGNRASRIYNAHILPTDAILSGPAMMPKRLDGGTTSDTQKGFSS